MQDRYCFIYDAFTSKSRLGPRIRAETISHGEFYDGNVQHEREFPNDVPGKITQKLVVKVAALSSCVLEQVGSAVHAGTESAQHLSIINGSLAGFMLLSRLLVYYISHSHMVYWPPVLACVLLSLQRAVPLLWHEFLKGCMDWDIQ